MGIASVAAGLAHGLLAPAHFEEWWGYGVFFLAAAVCQLVYGLALVTNAFGDKAESVRWWRLTYLAGAAGMACLILLYAYSRLVGIPLFGPSAGQVEGVAPVDLLVKVLEGIVVAGSLLLWASRPRAQTAAAASK